MNLLGIDIGTSKICGALFSTKTDSIIKTVSKSNNADIVSKLSYERLQDADTIFETVKEVISLFEEHVDGIGFSCQMHGIVYVDSNFNAVSPLYTWQDQRGNEYYDNNVTYANYLNSFTGYGNVTALFNERNNLVPNEAVYYCSIGDYVISKLCQTKVSTHITNAASFGCFDILRNVFTFENSYLPEITKEFIIVGTYNNIPVSVCLGDNQAAFIGTVKDENGILINIGTGGQISYLSGTYKNDACETRSFDGKRFLMSYCSLCGGKALAIFEKFCREIANLAGANIDSYYPIIDLLAKRYIDTDLTAFTNYNGSRENAAEFGGFKNLKESNFTPYDFTVAICISVIEELVSNSHINFKSGYPVYLSGNGARKNPIFKRILEKRYNLKVIESKFLEEAAVGAAVSCGVAVGKYPNIDIARNKALGGV